MGKYRLPDKEALDNLIKLSRLPGYEEDVMPIIWAYIAWLTDDDAYFNKGDEYENDFERRCLKEAQDYLAGGE